MNSYIFEIYVKDNHELKGFHVERLVATGWNDVINECARTETPVMMIKCVTPIKVV